MSLTTITNTVMLPGDVPAGDVRVVFSLLSDAFDPNTQSEILLRRETRTDRLTGQWSEQFVPNAELSPTGTAYQVREGNQPPLTFIVPASGSPVWLFNCLTVDPTSPDAPSVVRYDVAQTLTTGQEQQAQANLGLGSIATHPATDFIAASELGAPNGVATLNSSGLVSRALLPNISGVLDYTGVANQAAMLALTAPDADTQLRVQRTDTPGVQWVLNPGLNPATLANWLQEPFDSSGAAAAAQAAAIAASTSVTRGTTDLVDRTSTGSETAPIGYTTNAVAGAAYTAPTIPASVGTPPARWAVKAPATGASVTVTYPNSVGTTVVLTLLPDEVVTLRQKSTLGWGVESGNKTVGSLDSRYATTSTTAPTTLAQLLGYDPAVTDNPGKLRWFTTQEHVARALGWAIITDSRYAGGADPTGTNDSTAAILAAAASVDNSIGGTVWGPPGTYTCNTVASGVVLGFYNKQKFTLRGAGKSTIFQCTSATATDFMRFDTCARATITDFWINITGTANVQNALPITTSSPGSAHDIDVNNVIIYSNSTYRFAHECSIVSGSSVITSATAQFAPGDVGATIGVNQTTGPLVATISSVATVTGTVSNGGTAITAAQTTIPLAAALSGVPNAPYTIIIDSEIMQVTAGFQTATLTVARSAGSTSSAAATHNDGSTVTTYQATLSAAATATKMPSVARIQTPSSAVMVNGIVLGGDHPGASNIDLASVSLTKVAVNGAAGAAYQAGNGTAANVLANAAYGIEAGQSLYGLYLNGGGLKIRGGNFSTNGVDVKVGQICSDPISVSAFRTESPSRLYENELSTTASVPVGFTDIYVDSCLATDGQVMRHFGAAPLTLNTAQFLAWAQGRMVLVNAYGASASFPCNVIGINVTTNGGSSIWPAQSSLVRVVALGGGRLNSSGQLVQSLDGQRIDGAFVRPLAKQTLAAAGAVTIDASQGNAQITLSANATSSTITNPIDGQELSITWVQDSTGGRTYAWPTNCKFAGGSAPSDTTASKRTSARFVYDAASTNWYERSRAVAVG